MNDQSKPVPHPLRLTQAEGQPVSMDPSLPNAGLPEQMKGESAAQMASLVLAHLGNVFGGLHYGIEVELAGGDDAVKAHPVLKERIALAAEARVKGTIQEALNTLPEENEVNMIGLVVGRALAEDFLTRVDPVLNSQEQDDKGESDVDPDPAPDTTL